MSTVEHPRVKSGVLEDRLYQSNIAKTAVDHDTLVVLPTGLGKTAIAVRVAAEFLLRHPQQSVLVMAPTRPLVVQHARTLEGALVAPAPLVLTGTVAPERRAKLLQPPQVVVATPQVIGNDLEHGDFPLDRFSLIVFDEAHRAVGDYPYVAIGRINRETARARVLAMTASPGSRLERIRQVWANLGIERFEYRTVADADVLPYTHSVGLETVEVPVPVEVQHLAVLLRSAVQRATEPLQRQGLLTPGELSRRALLAIGERLHRELGAFRQRGEPAPPALWSAVTAHSVSMKGLHALELAETQGVDALREFLGRQSPRPGRRLTPAQRAFLGDPDIVRVGVELEKLTLEHPKLEAAVRVVTDQLHQSPEARVLVFTMYRQTAERLVTEFEARNDPLVRPARFVGQANREDDPGLSQKEQVALLDRFRSGEVNCLVATSVAEEGLDIPSTDLVVFYEPLPDVIRTIQRRGRTGRVRTGRAVVLVAAGTREGGMNRASRSKERRMHEMLEEVQAEAAEGQLPPATSGRQVQRSLLEFPGA